jgi:hypothetical protein
MANKAARILFVCSLQPPFFSYHYRSRSRPSPAPSIPESSAHPIPTALPENVHRHPRLVPSTSLRNTPTLQRADLRRFCIKSLLSLRQTIANPRTLSCSRKRLSHSDAFIGPHPRENIPGCVETGLLRTPRQSSLRLLRLLPLAAASATQLEDHTACISNTARSFQLGRESSQTVSAVGLPRVGCEPSSGTTFWLSRSTPDSTRHHKARFDLSE